MKSFLVGFHVGELHPSPVRLRYWLGALGALPRYKTGLLDNKKALEESLCAYEAALGESTPKNREKAARVAEHARCLGTLCRGMNEMKRAQFFTLTQGKLSELIMGLAAPTKEEARKLLAVVAQREDVLQEEDVKNYKKSLRPYLPPQTAPQKQAVKSPLRMGEATEEDLKSFAKLLDWILKRYVLKELLPDLPLSYAKLHAIRQGYKTPSREVAKSLIEAIEKRCAPEMKKYGDRLKELADLLLTEEQLTNRDLIRKAPPVPQLTLLPEEEQKDANKLFRALTAGIRPIEIARLFNETVYLVGRIRSGRIPMSKSFGEKACRLLPSICSDMWEIYGKAFEKAVQNLPDEKPVNVPVEVNQSAFFTRVLNAMVHQASLSDVLEAIGEKQEDFIAYLRGRKFPTQEQATGWSSGLRATCPAWQGDMIDRYWQAVKTLKSKPRRRYLEDLPPESYSNDFVTVIPDSERPLSASQNSKQEEKARVQIPESERVWRLEAGHLLGRTRGRIKASFHTLATVLSTQEHPLDPLTLQGATEGNPVINLKDVTKSLQELSAIVSESKEEDLRDLGAKMRAHLKQLNGKKKAASVNIS